MSLDPTFLSRHERRCRGWRARMVTRQWQMRRSIPRQRGDRWEPWCADRILRRPGMGPRIPLPYHLEESMLGYVTGESRVSEAVLYVLTTVQAWADQSQRTGLCQQTLVSAASVSAAPKPKRLLSFALVCGVRLSNLHTARHSRLSTIKTDLGT